MSRDHPPLRRQLIGVSGQRLEQRVALLQVTERALRNPRVHVVAKACRLEAVQPFGAVVLVGLAVERPEIQRVLGYASMAQQRKNSSTHGRKTRFDGVETPERVSR